MTLPDPMLITTPSPPDADGNLHIGPGFFLSLWSHFEGPPAQGFNWQVDFFTQGDTSEQGFYRITTDWNQFQSIVVHVGMQTDVNENWSQNVPIAGSTLTVNVMFKDGNQVLDQGQQAFQWDPTSNAWQLDQQTGAAGGLTDEEKQQLKDTTDAVTFQADPNGDPFPLQASVTAKIDKSTSNPITKTIGELFSGKTLSNLIDQEIGSGCDGSPIDADLVGGAYGLNLEMTQIPDWVAFTAPGESWTPSDLAVVQLWRGGDQLVRAGIHSRTWMLYPIPGVWNSPVTLDVPMFPPQFHVHVEFGTGCCGTLSAMELP